MTIDEIKRYLKNHKITYKDFSEICGVPEATLKNIFGGFTKAPRLDTVEALEAGIDKIKRSNGEYPIDLEEFDRMTRNNEIAYKISQMPDDVQDALFTFIDKMVERPKK